MSVNKCTQLVAPSPAVGVKTSLLVDQKHRQVPRRSYTSAFTSDQRDQSNGTHERSRTSCETIGQQQAWLELLSTFWCWESLLHTLNDVQSGGHSAAHAASQEEGEAMIGCCPAPLVLPACGGTLSHTMRCCADATCRPSSSNHSQHSNSLDSQMAGLVRHRMLSEVALSLLYLRASSSCRRTTQPSSLPCCSTSSCSSCCLQDRVVQMLRG